MKINYPDNEEFFSLGFYVDSRVLIPRNDTEIMVEKALKEFNNEDITYVDIGTGSACIAISILKNLHFDLEKSYGLDISLDALEVAKINVDKHQLQNKITLLHSNLGEVFLNNKIFSNTKKLIITANLPYIKNGDIKNIDKEVLKNEPHIALFGGEITGFELYEKLIGQIFELKKQNYRDIILFLEIGFDQYEYSKNYLISLGLSFDYYKDLNGIFRCIKVVFS